MQSSTIHPEDAFDDAKNSAVLTTGTGNSQISIPKPDEIGVSDIIFNDIEVWERYESAYCAFVSHGVYPAVLKRPFTEDDIGKSIQSSIVDFSTAHALQGTGYIEEMQMNLQYTVLQSALVLTISMPLYIEPPDFPRDDQLRVFSAIIGLAAFMQLVTIIGCTIISALFNRAYSAADAMVARVKAHFILVQVNVWNYLANFATIVAMLVAGFSRSLLDGAIHLYVGLLVILLALMFVGSTKHGDVLQDVRAYQFYKGYCDPHTGRLKDDYLKRIYAKRQQRIVKATKKSEKLEFVNKNNH